MINLLGQLGKKKDDFSQINEAIPRIQKLCLKYELLLLLKTTVLHGS